MEEVAQYEQYTKEELIQIIVDLKKEVTTQVHPSPQGLVAMR